MARNSKDTRRRLASGDKDRDPTVQMHHLGGSAIVAGSSHSNGHHNNGGNGSNNGKSKHRRCPASAGRLGVWSSFGLTDSAAVTKALLVLLSVVSISVALYYQHLVHLREMTVRTPLNSPKMLSENSTSPLMDPDRYWGTYRSHLYFGLKTRSPSSPVVGMMWMTEFTRNMPPPVRHWCDQGDNLLRYGWLKHDGVNFGIQEIVEDQYTIRTEFIKRPGGDYGGDWTTKIKITPKSSERHVVVSLMFYMALDGPGNLQTITSQNRLKSISGYVKELGDFELKFNKATSTYQKYHHLVTYVSNLDILKETVQGHLKVDAWDKGRTLPYFVLRGRSVPRDAPSGPNFIVHQVTAVLPVEMEIVFESQSYRRENSLQGDSFTNLLNSYVEEFDTKFENTFHLKEKDFKTEEINFAKAALSNMLGSIGYFYGESQVKSIYTPEPVKYWETSLYTAVPSRSFFPRGFLWDEGFHNLLIVQWNPTISKDIISHWLDLINVEGWIPREQILGSEAQRKVPAEFVVQHNTNANPPTLFLPLQKIIKTLVKSEKPEDRAFLKAVYPRLKAWYAFYNETQSGNIPGTYRWRGRDPLVKRELNPKTLTSGLDDYPRASHPTDYERHIDLRCWMALASGVMLDIAKTLKMDWKPYEETYNMLTDNQLMNVFHWSESKQQYCDFGLHSDKVKLEQPKAPPPKPGQPPIKLEKVRVNVFEPKIQFVNSFGYVSLFPFLLKIVNPDSPKLMKILKDLQDTQLLWTDYGLRSLARTAPLYNRYNTEHDPPYWRGAIWININYLALQALHHYSTTEGPYQSQAKTIYDQLRANIIRNMYKEYSETGYIWEQYNDRTGKGKGSHPFTGWSALVVLMMAEKY
ncbi:mannosyl-oligosaccharide glucosidase [Octopus bimaculoides]|nr:mannosyl-oligosaccharide glucosidase [Octopus bimaculoides]|eukprot:XP_014771134.1 PREDICTED: mannosyl-oligosaccharide glucosidase-like [Octopus bimaculoides]